eukprot:GSA25T00008435001.1
MTTDDSRTDHGGSESPNFNHRNIFIRQERHLLLPPSDHNSPTSGASCSTAGTPFLGGTPQLCSGTPL